MGVHVLLYSPTGSSRRVALAVARRLSPGAPRVVDVTVLDPALPELTQDDLVVLAAPVYGGHLPRLFTYRLRHLAGNAANAVALVVYGNRAFEHALSDLVSFCGSHNLGVVAAGAFVGEHTQSTVDHPVAAGRPDEGDLADAEQLAALVADKLADRGPVPVDVGCLCEPSLPLGRRLAFARDYVAFKVRGFFQSAARRLPTTDVGLCDDCGACVRGCPMHAVFNAPGKPTSKGCNGCRACERHCHTGARQCPTPLAAALEKYCSARKPNAYVV